MSNLNPTIYEYLILVLGLIAVVALAILGKLPTESVINFILIVFGYAFGSAKGSAIVSALQSANNANVVTSSQPGVSAASPQAANTTDATK